MTGEQNETLEAGVGFSIEVLSEPYPEVAVPVPGGCNSSSNSSCSNDAQQLDPQ